MVNKPKTKDQGYDYLDSSQYIDSLVLLLGRRFFGLLVFVELFFVFVILIVSNIILIVLIVVELFFLLDFVSVHVLSVKAAQGWEPKIENNCTTRKGSFCTRGHW